MQPDLGALILQELRSLTSKVARVEEAVEDARKRSMTAEAMAMTAAQAAGLSPAPDNLGHLTPVANTPVPVRSVARYPAPEIRRPPPPELPVSMTNASLYGMLPPGSQSLLNSPHGRLSNAIPPLENSLPSSAQPGSPDDQRLFVCNICHKRLASQKTLVAHNRKMHSTGEDSERLQRCPQCGAEFLWRSHLIGHIKAVHEKVKPHQCDQCRQAFALLKDLKRHVRTKHDGIKPFVCQHCGVAFGRKDTLVKHVTKKHSDTSLVVSG